MTSESAAVEPMQLRRRDRGITGAGDPVAAFVRDWQSIEPMRLTPIMAGALKVFSDKGYHGTTVRDIAETAGVRVPALYYHHTNKQGLLLDLLDTGFAELLGRADAAVRSAGDDVVLGFRNLVIAACLHMTYRHKIAILDPEMRHLDSEHRAHYAMLRAELEMLMGRLVNEARRRELFDTAHAEDACRAIFGMLSSISLWYRADGPLTAQEIAQQYVVVALRVVGASDEDIQRFNAQAIVASPNAR